MTLPSFGTISSSMINLELGRAANAPFFLGGSQERALAGIVYSAISFADFYGKSAAAQEPPVPGELPLPPAREPQMGEYYTTNYCWVVAESWDSSTQSHHIYWGGLLVSAVSSDGSTAIHDGWRYHKGEFKSITGEAPWDFYNYGIWREKL